MIQPEEDFQTWILIVSSTIDDPDQFVYFIPDIERLIDSIMETDSLPDPLENDTETFIVSLNKDILFKVLNVSQIGDEELANYSDLFYKIIDFGKYGIDVQDDKIIRCAYTILKYYQSPIYKISESFTYNQICDYAFDQELYLNAYNSIADGPETLSLLTIYYRLVDELSFYDDDFDWTDFSINCANAALKIAKINPRLNVKTIDTMFTQILSSSIQQNVSAYEFCPPWLNFFLFFVKSGIFEKQLYCLQQIESLLHDPIMIEGCLSYFEDKTANPLKIFEEMKTIHPELCKPISQILSILAEYGLINDQLISHLWHLHSVQHRSDLSKFFVIFSSIASTLPVEQLPRLIEQCINPAEGCESEEWINFLRVLAETLGKRDNADASFALVRNKLLEIALSEPKFDLVISARKVLPYIIRFWLDQNVFMRIYEQLSNLLNGCKDFEKIIFLFNLFSSALYTQKFQLSKEQSKELLDKSFLFIQEKLPIVITEGVDLNSDSRDVVLNFISSLCYNNVLVLSNEQLDIAFAYKQSKIFGNLISRLLLKNLVSIDHLTKLITELKDIDENIFVLVRNIVVLTNNLTKTTHLPLLHEDLIWDLALIESKQRIKFAALLCSIYSNNDKTQLNDYSMMNFFIQKWNQKFNEIPSHQKTAAICLLRIFINDIESKVDLEMYSIHRHISNFNLNKIHVDITGNNLPCPQSYDLPENTTLMMLKQRVSKTSLIPMNSFVFTRYSKICDLTNTLKMVAGNADKIALNVTLKRLQEGGIETRDILPSQLILQRYPETFDLLISLLKDESVSQEAKLILNYLPTHSMTLLKIEEIKRCKSFDYKAFFSTDYPNLFMYNFESLQEVFESESDRKYFIQTGGFLYFIDVLSPLNNPQLNRKISLFLKKEIDDQIISEIGQKICDKLIPFLSQTAIDSQSTQFAVFSDFLKPIFEHLNKAIVLQKDFSDAILKPLLLSPFSNIRHIVSRLFVNLPISLSMFCNLIEFIDDNTASTFYQSLLPHVNKETLNDVILNGTNEIDIIIEKIKEGVQNLPPYLIDLLLILDKLLEISSISPDSNLISKSDIEFLTQKLIDRFLYPDPREKEKKLFTCAIKCLYRMNNQILLRHLNALHTGRTNYPDWDIDGDSNIISPTGHCGLVNLGATCFLNSTLQQFFAIPCLRNAILKFNDNTNDFLNELKILFAEMFLSNGELINPSHLIDVWTGWDGEPMDASIQQDALEFTQMLIDKLEGGLTPAFLNEIFGGTQINQFIGISESYQSKNEQPFTSLTLPIQDSTNVYEAFSKMQNPNFFTGENQYYAESLHKKIDAKNIQKLGKLPQILILQLSRFEYNYQLGIRTKINSIFNFPSELDLKDFTDGHDEQVHNYELRGVVMHQGTADFGHYTSYIKDLSNNKWYLYNDSIVTEVTESEVLINGSGKEGSSLSGYILFYDRIDTIPKNKEILLAKPTISPNLVHQIQNENRQKDEYRLFCSEPYFEFMVLLASTTPQFAMISLKYYFDTFPFTLHVKRANELELEICEQLDNSPELVKAFAQYLNQGPFACSLIYCPCSPVRIGALNMIKKIPLNQIGLTFIDRIINCIPTIVPYYYHFNYCFELLHYFISNSSDILNYVVDLELCSILIYMLTNGIPKYISQQGDEQHFYSHTNFTGILKLFEVFYSKYSNPEMDRFIKFVLNENFFRNLLSSKSSIHSIAQLLRSFNREQQIHDFLINFTEKSGIYVHYFRIGHLLLDYFNVQAIDTISRCHFFIGSRPANRFDLAMLIYMICVKDPPMRDALFEKAEYWLFDLLTDDSLECRITTEHSIAVLIPDRVFMDSIALNTYKEINNLDEIEETFVNPLQSRPDHELQSEMSLFFDYKESIDLNLSKRIFDILISKKHDFIEKLKNCVSKTENDYQNCNPLHFGAFLGYQYIDVIDRLSILNKIDISKDLVEIALNIIQPKSEIFDICLSRICVSLKRLRKQNRDSLQIGSNFDYDKFFIQFFPHPLIESPMIKLRTSTNVSYSSSLPALKISLFFFNDMKDSIEGKYPIEFINGFLRYYAFSSASKSCNRYDVIQSYIQSFAKSNPNELFGVLAQYAEAFSTAYFSGVLISLDYLNSNEIKYRLPLLNYLWNAVNQKQQFAMNELVTKAFKYNVLLKDDLISNNNLVSIISLLNSPGLLDDGRECIWKLIFEKKNVISIDSFVSKYKWKGDWVNVAKFIKENSDNQQTNEAMIEATPIKSNNENELNFKPEKEQNSIQNEINQNEHSIQNENEVDQNEHSNEMVNENQVEFNVPVQQENGQIHNGKFDLIQLALEASRESIDAFSLLFDFLLKNASDELYSISFGQSIVEHEIDLVNAELVVRYIQLVTNVENEKKIDQETLLTPLANKFNLRAKFLNDMFIDVMSNENLEALKEIKESDVNEILGLLSVLNQFDKGKELIKEEKDKLKKACDNQDLFSKLKINLMQLKQLL